MKPSARKGVVWRRVLHALVAAVSLLALLPLSPAGTDAAGIATITVTSYAVDGVTPLPFARFQVIDSHGTVYGPLEAPPPTAQVSFFVDPVDSETTFTIIEETPPPCGIAPDPLVIGPLVDGQTVEVTFATDFYDCDLGAISAYKFLCPVGFDTSATDYASWRDGCFEPVNGATFEFRRASGGQWTAVTGAYGIPGRAPLVGLEPDDYWLGEVGAAGTPVVYCLNYPSPNPAEAPAPDSITREPLVDGAVRLTIYANRIACDFFYPQEIVNDVDDGGIILDDMDDGGGIFDDDVGNAQNGTASLFLRKLICPPGLESDFFETCFDNRLEGVTFEVTGPGGYAASETTDSQGIAFFDGLEAGTYRVGEDIPGDVNDIFVYCSEGGERLPVTFNEVGGIDLEISEGDEVFCDWYNIPVQQFEFGSIEVIKLTCPVGYDASAATYGDFLTDCTDATENVTFFLTRDGVSEQQETTDGDGFVAFESLAPGNYRLTEDVPDEFTTPYAFCTVNDGAPFQADTSDGGAYFALDGSGQAIACTWFNVPEDLSGDPGQVTIRKLLCPPGLTSNYFDNCFEDKLPGVTFEASGPGGYSASDTTDSQGLAFFDGLAAGDYVFTEVPPGDVNVAVYVVYCSESGERFPFTYDDATGMRIRLSVGPGDQIVCDWYNVPPAPPKPTAKGSITIHKFLCLGKENHDYDWQRECEVYDAGADFELTTSGGAFVARGTTDADGILVFTGLANGAYGLDETSGDWCRAEADLVDANGNVVVVDQGNTDVFIYNCTADKISTLPSTGAGPMVSGAATPWSLAGGLLGLLAIGGWRPALAARRLS